MMGKLLSGTVIAVFSSGCSAPASLDVGYHGTEAGYAVAIEAAEAWNQTCGLELIVVHRGDGGVQLEEHMTPSETAMGHTSSERPFLNLIGPLEPKRIWFARGEYELPSLAHEFGHALGLEHADYGIMQPGKQWYQLDPVNRTTLARGVISDRECELVRR